MIQFMYKHWISLVIQYNLMYVVRNVNIAIISFLFQSWKKPEEQ